MNPVTGYEVFIDRNVRQSDEAQEAKVDHTTIDKIKDYIDVITAFDQKAAADTIATFNKTRASKEQYMWDRLMFHSIGGAVYHISKTEFSNTINSLIGMKPQLMKAGYRLLANIYGQLFNNAFIKFLRKRNHIFDGDVPEKTGGIYNDYKLARINKVVVTSGKRTFSIAADEIIREQCDPFVVETDVHFPNDINLLDTCPANF